MAFYGHPLGAYGSMNTAERAFNAHFVSGLARASGEIPCPSSLPP